MVYQKIKKRKQNQLKIEQLKSKGKIYSTWGEYYNLKNRKNWGFQIDCIKHITKYLKNLKYVNDSPEATLVKMPTGSGKTAIMALTSNYLIPKKNILIIVPSSALTHQISEYLNFKHWLIVEHIPPKIKNSITILPSTFIQELSKNMDTPINYICTTKAMSDIYLADKEGEIIDINDNSYNNLIKYKNWTLYDIFQDVFDVVFVDEGHREPAKTWSRAVRNLKKPTILFSATPYRNDRRFFNLKNEFYELSFQKAYEEYKCIRNVLFIPNTKKEEEIFNKLDTSSENYYERFLKLFITSFIKQIENCKIQKPKAIIRCETHAQISKIVNYLNNLPDDIKSQITNNPKLKKRKIAIGIHDQFTNENKNLNKKSITEKYFFHSVNNSQDKYPEAIFWVHQFKLLEGIDDKSYIMLGIYAPFSNSRSLVQQIGRIIRRDSSIQNKLAYIYSNPIFDLKSEWEGYTSYEKIPKAKKIIGTEQIVERILDSFPEYFYFDKKFSKVKKIKYKEWEEKSKKEKQKEIKKLVENDLKIPKITNIYNIDVNCKLYELLEEFSDILEDKDIIVLQRGLIPMSNCEIGIIIGWDVKPSKYLADSIFFDISFTAFSIIKIKNYIFYRGNLNLPNYINKTTILKTIEPSKMESLVSPLEGNPQIKQISVVNTDASSNAVRRRVEGGNNLSNTAPYLDDHLHLVRSAVTLINKTQRYVGLTRSRLTENNGIFITLSDYLNWAKDIIKNIESINKKLKKIEKESKSVKYLNYQIRKNYFKRYACQIDSPEKCKPAHILIDLTSFYNMFKCELNNGEYKNIDDCFNESFYEKAISEDEIIENASEGKWEFSLNFQDDINNTNQIDKYQFQMELYYNKGKFKIKPKKKDRDRFNKKFKINYEEVKKENSIISEKSAHSFFKKHIVIRIITQDHGFYTDGYFFDPTIKLWGNDRLSQSGTIYGIKEMKNIIAEKESDNTTWVNNVTWPMNTLFKAIDSIKNKKYVKELNNQISTMDPFFIPDYLICDDKAGELADFIAFTTTKIVLIYAKKATKDGTASALSLQKVTDQVIKNLRAFDPYTMSKEEMVTEWQKNWKGKMEIPRVRVNKENISVNSIINKMIKLIKKGVDREIWIFYGNGFSEKEFFKEIRKENPKYHYKHLVYTIINCNEAANRARAKLRIFTQP